MRDLRKHLAGETYDSGRNTVEGMGYLDTEYDVLRFSHACNSIDHGQAPSVLNAGPDGYRAIAHDFSGDRSDLWREVNSDVARSGRKEHKVKKKALFWERGRPNCGVLQDAATIIERVAMLHVHYDNALISFEQWGVETTLQRPAKMSEVFPASVTFKPMPPPELLEEYGLEGAKAAVRAAVAKLQAERLTASVDELEPFQLDCPKYLGTDQAAVKQAEEDYDDFCERHYRAYTAFRSGRRNVIFPAGTVFWRCRANVRVEVSAQR